ncbi:hypothetical protein ACFFX0_14560 [Citricoccus parietis]|uniref:Uncharacterized protein n=1 Tax=Citricoccus parietis TaxID=592307 RepID=A0ABV5G080_9MICC
MVRLDLLDGHRPADDAPTGISGGQHGHARLLGLLQQGLHRIVVNHGSSSVVSIRLVRRPSGGCRQSSTDGTERNRGAGWWGHMHGKLPAGNRIQLPG